MSFWGTIEKDAEGAVQWVEKEGEIVWKDVEDFVSTLIQDEENTFNTEILPLLRAAAVTLQNESPGLDAQQFIPALVGAFAPILPVAFKDLSQTFLYAVGSAIAEFFGVTNTPGNQGNVDQPSAT